MRTELKVFRVRKNLSQEAFSEKIGCRRATLAAIENGTRNGRKAFWDGIKTAFGISDADLEELKKNE